MGEVGEASGSGWVSQGVGHASGSRWVRQMNQGGSCKWVRVGQPTGSGRVRVGEAGLCKRVGVGQSGSGWVKNVT